MNGLIIPKTPIAVDFWKPRQCPHVKLYFLTHMHADHTHGLSSSWNYHKIYCSETTKKLALLKFGIKEEFLVALPMEQSVIIPLDELGTESVTVTAIDANHCPGAVMFLFEGYFGRILYTGDFRYSDTMLSYPMLINNVSKSKAIDVLYLDNTYCDPKCVFPSRVEATAMVINIIRQYPEHNVVIGVRSIGKEGLLEKIALSFNSWIAVDLKRLEILRICKCADVFVTDAEITRFRVVSASKITKLNVNKWNQERPTIVILPTCLFEGTDVNPYTRTEGIFVVPYSDHSSYTELIEFVGLVQPKKVVPIVHHHRGIEKGTQNSRAHMSCFNDKLNPEPQKEFCVPTVVQRFMSMASRCSNTNSALNRQGSSTRCKPRKHVKPCGVIFNTTSDDLTCSLTNKQELSNTKFNDPKNKTEICSLVPEIENGLSAHCVPTMSCERKSEIVDDEDKQSASVPSSKDVSVGYSGEAVDYSRKNNDLQLENTSIPERSSWKDQTNGIVNDELSRWSQHSPIIIEVTFVDSKDVVTNCGEDQTNGQIVNDEMSRWSQHSPSKVTIVDSMDVVKNCQTEPKENCDDQELTDNVLQSSVCGRDKQSASVPSSKDVSVGYSGEAVDYSRKNNDLQLENTSVPERSSWKDQTNGIVNDEMSGWSQHSPIELTFNDSRDVVTNCQTEPMDSCDDQELTDSVSQSSVCGRRDFMQRCRTTKKLNINFVRKTKPGTCVYGAQYHSAFRAVLDALKTPNKYRKSHNFKYN